MLDELAVVDVLLEAAQDEVEVVGQPADGKCQHHQYHGLHKLVRERLRSVLGPSVPSHPSWEQRRVPFTLALTTFCSQTRSTSLPSIPWNVYLPTAPEPTTSWLSHRLGCLHSLLSFH